MEKYAEFSSSHLATENAVFITIKKPPFKGLYITEKH